MTKSTSRLDVNWAWTLEVIQVLFLIINRSVIGDVQMKTTTIHGKVDSGSQGNAGNQLLTHEVQDKLNSLSGDVGKLLRKSDVS